MKPELSIVVPAYEEQGRLGSTIASVAEYLLKEQLNAELIVVDDGSKDRTVAVADETFAQFPHVNARTIKYDQNRGKGYAIKVGMQSAAADIVLFSDADLSTPIAELPKLVEPIRRGEIDVAIGSRAIDRSLIGTHQPWRREQGGRLMNLIIRTLSGLSFADTQCGFKAFNMKRFRPLLELMTIDRFGFDVEFLFVAAHHGLRMAEIPVRWNNVEGSKVSIVRDTRRMMTELLTIRANAKRGAYELAAGDVQ